MIDKEKIEKITSKILSTLPLKHEKKTKEED